MHDLDSIYKVPLFMENQGALEFLQDRLNFPINMAYNRIFMKQWKKLSDKYNSLYNYYIFSNILNFSFYNVYKINSNLKLKI